jgi:hypothetical protein
MQARGPVAGAVRDDRVEQQFYERRGAAPFDSRLIQRVQPS